MGRSESAAVTKQGQQQSSQDQANAQAALAKTGEGVDQYNQNLKGFMRFGRRTYGEGGDYQRTQNTLATNAASAGSRALEGDLSLRSMRTGENTAGYASADAEDRRARQRDLVNEMAGANSDRMAKLTAINQYGVDASKLPAEVYSNLYGTSLGGANSAMGNAANAAKTPGFWDTFGPALIGAGGSVATGFTPRG